MAVGFSLTDDEFASRPRSERRAIARWALMDEGQRALLLGQIRELAESLIANTEVVRRALAEVAVAMRQGEEAARAFIDALPVTLPVKERRERHW